LSLTLIRHHNMKDIGQGRYSSLHS
jgi:hypothetical protein